MVIIILLDSQTVQRFCDMPVCLWSVNLIRNTLELGLLTGCCFFVDRVDAFVMAEEAFKRLQKTFLGNIEKSPESVVLEQLRDAEPFVAKGQLDINRAVN